MTLQFIRNRGAAWGAIVLLAVLIFVPRSPAHIVDPGRDASAYLYVGNAVLDGHIPYRDAWDHKQPLTYLILAVGLWIGGRSFWGPWALECVFLSVTGILSYSTLARVVSRRASFFLTVISLLTLSLILWNYSTEELSLPFQMGALYAFIAMLAPTAGRRKKTWLSLLIGTCVSCAFFIQQSLVAVGFSILAFLVLRSAFARGWRDLLYLIGMAGGFCIVALPVLFYLSANHALADYWNAAFLFNFLYSNLGLLERLRAVFDFLENLRTYPGLFISFGMWIALLLVWLFQQGPRLAGWLRRSRFTAAMYGSGGAFLVLCLAGLLLSRSQGFGLLKTASLAVGLLLVFTGILVSSPSRRDWLVRKLDAGPVLPIPTPPDPAIIRLDLLGLAVILFPATLALMSLSGQTYIYYLIMLYPAMVLILGLVCGMLLDLVGGAPAGRILRVTLAGVTLALAYNPALQWLSDLRATPEPTASAAIRYIQETTRPDDPLYVWGDDIFFYFQTGRSAPTRYFNQIALGWTGYGERFSVVDEMLSAFQERKPVLIVIQRRLLPQETFNQCPSPTGGSSLPAPLFSFLCNNYVVDRSFGEYGVFREKK